MGDLIHQKQKRIGRVDKGKMIGRESRLRFDPNQDNMEFTLDHHSEKRVIQEMLPPGTYFIGDIFYALKEKYVEVVYQNLEENVLEFKVEREDAVAGAGEGSAGAGEGAGGEAGEGDMSERLDETPGHTIVFDKVFGGKERYRDCYGHEYEVESEYLGIVPIELCQLSDDDEDIDEIGQRIEFDAPVSVYIVNGIFMLHWEGGFLKIDTKNLDYEPVEDYEYNDITFEEYMFEMVNETRDDEEAKKKNQGEYRDVENTLDYDEEELEYDDPENKPIDPALLEVRYIDEIRGEKRA
jgi:hypothetical protein